MKEFEELRAHFDSVLVQILKEMPAEPKLKEILHYVLFPGGKRIRPLLMYAVCMDLGGDPVKADHFAVAVELIHTSSLIHDDLPAIDNDDFRRGRTACHKQFGEGEAILAADFLIGWALKTAMEAPLTPPIIGEAANELTSSFMKLCRGQLLDIDKRPSKSREDISDEHRLKTGALFGAAGFCGSLAAASTQSQQQCGRRYGELFGEVFQLLDDGADLGDISSEERRLTALKRNELQSELENCLISMHDGKCGSLCNQLAEEFLPGL